MSIHRKNTSKIEIKIIFKRVVGKDVITNQLEKFQSTNENTRSNTKKNNNFLITNKYVDN